MATTFYVWDRLSNNVLCEYDDQGNQTVRYNHEPGQYGRLISQRRGEATSTYHYDGMGNTVALSDENGDVTDTYEHSAFGSEIAKTGTTVNPFGFQGALGYYANPGTDDLYVRARHYSPINARWLSPEPFGLEGPNYYTYSSNNPVRFNDPSGLFSCNIADKKCGVDSFVVKWTKPSASDEETAETIHKTSTFVTLDVRIRFKDDDSHDPACCEYRQFADSMYRPLSGRGSGYWIPCGRGPWARWCYIGGAWGYDWDGFLEDDNYDRGRDQDFDRSPSDPNFRTNDHPGPGYVVPDSVYIRFGFEAKQQVIDICNSDRVVAVRGPHKMTVSGRVPRTYRGVPKTLGP